MQFKAGQDFNSFDVCWPDECCVAEPAIQLRYDPSELEIVTCNELAEISCERNGCPIVFPCLCCVVEMSVKKMRAVCLIRAGGMGDVEFGARAGLPGVKRRRTDAVGIVDRALTLAQQMLIGLAMGFETNTELKLEPGDHI